jgi:hypothetical protein
MSKQKVTYRVGPDPGVATSEIRLFDWPERVDALTEHLATVFDIIDQKDQKPYTGFRIYRYLTVKLPDQQQPVADSAAL